METFAPLFEEQPLANSQELEDFLRADDGHRFGRVFERKVMGLRLRAGTPVDLPFPLSTVDAAVLGHLVVDPLEEAIAQGWQGIKSSGSSGAPFSHNRNSAADVLGRALDGEVELAYFVRPPTVQQVVSVASEGLLLPPKSTNFTPKPTKGLLMNSLRSF